MRPTVIVATLLASLASPAGAGAPEPVQIHGPGPLRIVGAEPPLDAACAPVATARGCTLPCRPALPTMLTLQLAGYELRTVELPGDFQAGEVDLRDGRWVPTSVVLTLEPAAPAATATAVWVRDGEVVAATPTEGLVSGPRVPPRERYRVGVVGAEVRAVALDDIRWSADKPLHVQLQSGSSRAVVCRDPWNGKIIAGCTVTVGGLPQHLKVAGPRLLPRGQVTTVSELLLVDSEEGGEWLVAEAEGFPATVRRLGELPLVAEVPLDPPRELAVRLEDEKSGTEISGTVRIARHYEDAELLVAEAPFEAGTAAAFVVGPGAYTVTGEAPGYRPNRMNVVVERPRTAVAVRLRKAAVASGRVLDGGGQPLPGAVVVALSRAFTFDGMENAAAADATGRFAVTLAGEGPWTLVAQLDGYAGPPATLTAPDENVTIVLEPRCRVAILPLGSDGSNVHTDVLMLVHTTSWEVVPAAERAADGAFQVELWPGEWVAIVEEAGLRGRFTLPPACHLWRGTVLMQPASP